MRGPRHRERLKGAYGNAGGFSADLKTPPLDAFGAAPCAGALKSTQKGPRTTASRPRPPNTPCQSVPLPKGRTALAWPVTPWRARRSGSCRAASGSRAGHVVAQGVVPRRVEQRDKDALGGKALLDLGVELLALLDVDLDGGLLVKGDHVFGLVEVGVVAAVHAEVEDELHELGGILRRRRSSRR